MGLGVQGHVDEQRSQTHNERTQDKDQRRTRPGQCFKGVVVDGSFDEILQAMEPHGDLNLEQPTAGRARLWRN